MHLLCGKRPPFEYTISLYETLQADLRLATRTAGSVRQRYRNGWPGEPQARRGTRTVLRRVWLTRHWGEIRQLGKPFCAKAIDDRAEALDAGTSRGKGAWRSSD
jgi:hypothetical protein